MKIGIGSDHAGYKYKEELKMLLGEMGHDVVDFGTDSDESCDYPDFCIPVAKAIASGEVDRGIVLGGSGNGEAISANRIKGVRCALCWDAVTARLSREHNNANAISIGERMITLETAGEIVKTWLSTEFQGGRHQRRIEKIDELS